MIVDYTETRNWKLVTERYSESEWDNFVGNLGEQEVGMSIMSLQKLGPILNFLEIALGNDGFHRNIFVSMDRTRRMATVYVARMNTTTVCRILRLTKQYLDAQNILPTIHKSIVAAWFDSVWRLSYETTETTCPVSWEDL